MTRTAVLFFLLAAALAALGLADQRKLYWRFAAWRFRNPEANEPSDAAFAWQRGVLFVAAAVIVFQGCSAMDSANKASWSEEELRQAVARAASSLEDEPQVSAPAEDYSGMIEDAVVDAGKGSGPGYAVSVEASDPDAQSRAGNYVVTADGADAAFCMSISRSLSEDGGFSVPGVGDQSGSHVPAYDLKVRVSEGRC
ncbi:hypothetical protein [Streptomyces sp. NPDC020298]|uniref:hypothetical protein n=1 Tax=unclassified Streptomyces TaxID=2593676 RepID=UPI0033BFD2F1